MAANEGGNENWSEAVEDLVENGDVDGAISLLKSAVSKLESLTLSSPDPGSQLQLAAALGGLADLYSGQGFSLNADKLRSQSLLIRARVLNSEPRRPGNPGSLEEKAVQEQQTENATSSNQCQEEEDDWEAIADLDSPLSKFSLSVQPEKGEVLDHSKEDKPLASPRRRGRGSFLYRKNELYSDQVDSGAFVDEDFSVICVEDEAEAENQRYGTSHVIVLYDFPPTMSTSQLENLFYKFRGGGFAIRWVSDTVALAVFRTPSAAHEAKCSIEFPFKARRLEEKDIMPLKISHRDLEPPLVRPKTSARTAQRLISHAMGIELSSNPGSDEFRQQEAARKNRILQRQSMRSDAWGSD